MPHLPRSTPPGQHRPVLLDEVLQILDPQPGEIVVDCTVGFGGHAVELMKRVGPGGRLIGLDLDAEHLPRARERLEAVGPWFELHHANFAGLPAVLAAAGCPRVDAVLADLGMSSMQVDDPSRGFSYVREGPLDMRLDRSRGKTAAQLLQTISQEELARALAELGDEPEAARIAAAVILERKKISFRQTSDLARIITQVTNVRAWRLRPARGKWNLHPAARTFQALRILVNRELGNLGNLLRVLPDTLKSGGRAGVISFHSGEDRLVKAAFRQGLHLGVYQQISSEPMRPSFAERQMNPRSRSAKFRWGRC